MTTIDTRTAFFAALPEIIASANVYEPWEIETFPAKRAASTVTVSTDAAVTRQLMTGKQAAARLGVTEDHLAALVQDGELSYINVGRGTKRPRRRFTEADLEEFEARRRRREACLSTNPKSHRSTNSISNSVVIGFSAQRSARLAKKQKNSKQ